jgi:hypothetical protein
MWRTRLIVGSHPAEISPLRTLTGASVEMTKNSVACLKPRNLGINIKHYEVAILPIVHKMDSKDSLHYSLTIVAKATGFLGST